MQGALILLALVTLLYAGYNLFIKVSSSHVPAEVTSTIVATISLQISALLVSCVFLAGLLIRGNAVLALPPSSLLWAALAGICIGAAEIGYFYLFRGGATFNALAANVAIPVIVSGTILITIVVSWLVLRESMNFAKFVGAAAIMIGVALMFIESKS